MEPTFKRSSFSRYRKLIWMILTLLALLVLASCSGRLPDTGNTTAGGTALSSSTAAFTQAQAATQPDPTLLEPTQSVPATPMTTQPSQAGESSQSPQCTSPADLTPSLTEGPYFKAGSPERTSLLESGMTGTKLVITGYVLTADCKPVAGALLDFWQADAQGQYDNAGYTLRGHQLADANGRYRLETVVPGLYPGRTEHIHVKVQAPGGPVLTTQLFFPGVPDNESDGIFSPKLVIAVQDTGDGILATYTFVVATQ